MNKPDLSQYSEDTVKLVKSLSYMSDRFMSIAFQDHEVQQHIIRTVLNDPDIDLKDTVTQSRFNNILGREITFDSMSRDTNGDVYNVEVENRVERRGFEQVTYHTSALDTQSVHKGITDFRKFPKANGIMFVYGDALHNGKQKSVFEIRDTDNPQEHVETSRLKYVIVNVQKCGGNDPLSQLCRDLQQSDYRNICNEHLAERMKEIKEGMEVEQMCRLEEEYGNRRYEKGITEGRAEGVEYQNRIDTIKLLKMNWTLEQISDFVERSIEEVESWAMESSLPYRRS